MAARRHMTQPRAPTHPANCRERVGSGPIGGGVVGSQQEMYAIAHSDDNIQRTLPTNHAADEGGIDRNAQSSTQVFFVLDALMHDMHSMHYICVFHKHHVYQHEWLVLFASFWLLALAVTNRYPLLHMYHVLSSHPHPAPPPPRTICVAQGRQTIYL